MKHTTLTSRTPLGLALLGALAAAPSLTSVAHADAPDTPALNGDRDFGRDDNDGDRDNNRRGDKAARSGRGGRRGSADGRGKGGPRDGTDERAELGRRDDRGPRGGRNNQGGAGKGGRAEFGGRDNGRGRTNSGGRGRDNALGGNRDGRFDQSPVIAPQFVGVVTKVKSSGEFDIRMDDKTYNVYLSAPAGAVRVGQTVQLNGERIGTNDIRSASLLQPRRR